MEAVGEVLGFHAAITEWHLSFATDTTVFQCTVFAAITLASILYMRIEGFDPNAYKLLAKSGYDPKEPQRLGKLILERVAKGFQDSMKFIQIRGWGMFHQNGQDVQEKALADSNGQQDDLEITIKDAKKLIKRSKAKLKEIHDQKKNLEALITEAQQQLDDAQGVVSNAEEEVLRIQNNDVLIDDTEEDLNDAKKEV
nr:uncharacterized protein LOC109150426 [Ipomoea trifida]